MHVARLLPWLLMLAAVPITVRPQATGIAAPSPTVSGGWVFKQLRDDFANSSAQTIGLMAEDSIETGTGFIRPQLIIACTNDKHAILRRRIYVVTGVRLERHEWSDDPLHKNEPQPPTTIELRFDSDKKPSAREAELLAHGDGFYVSAKGFLATNTLYDDDFLKTMLRSRELKVRFTTLVGSEVETVGFNLQGLGLALPQLSDCSWPKA
jgi:hypothetical protein